LIEREIVWNKSIEIYIAVENAMFFTITANIGEYRRFASTEHQEVIEST
jgi:hypothetical protein